jgi:hypothetical protein
MLNFDNDANLPEIGPFYCLKSVDKLLKLKKQDLSSPACMDYLPPYSKSKEYFMHPLKRTWPRIKGATADKDHERNG